MHHSMARATGQPQAGIVDDIEREDDLKGYEPEDVAVVGVAQVLAGWELAA
ncbi:hypothetical protein OHB41_49620 [Streptomyces sp. NBC_01571]|uniref:hypothetical protein n=1 Tax=Streptomyces sp. NBC_01571 TaxID=2975883 RepID=UPI002256AB85|nr:hypothetical protein [Streptomyces sp. NBC_01571]MCX4581022.1 hypothetical protein [Streptomyces sp. NBC_01571]